MIRLAFRLARRELRGGVRGLRIVLACLALGVAAIAAVGSLRAAVQAGLAADGRRILGGDIEVESGAEPIPPPVQAWLAACGARLSGIVRMRAMLVASSGERMLVELKAVDGTWPLVGSARIAPAQGLDQALGARDGVFGMLVDQLVLDRLGLAPGAAVRIGAATMAVRGALSGEPDRVATASLFGPRALIGLAALPATDLVRPGAMLTHALRATLPAGTDIGALITALHAAFPDQGLRVRSAAGAVPGLVRFIDQTALFMTLAGLTALLVGGIGVANGTRAWLDARSRSLAVLRCLGAPGRLVFLVCVIQVMALSSAGIVLGVAAGAALPAGALFLFGDALPVPPRIGLYPAPLLLAALFGLLTAAAFALWPLARARAIPGAALFRDALIPTRVRPGIGLIAAEAALVAALVGLAIATAPERRFAMWFCTVAAGSLVLFRLAAAALSRLAGLAPRLPSPAARLGLANLHRPGAATPLMLVSLGLGLSTLAAVALIEANIRRQVLDELPRDAPSFYFIDIQPDELTRFEAILHATAGVESVQQVPSLRARLVAVNGVPAEQVKATPDTAWALRGDRGLTYAAEPPAGTRLVAGAWWPRDYAGAPLLSFDAELARGWGVGVGDTMIVNVLGRDITLRIASLREIDWRSFSLNFTMIASPGLLASAPHTHIAAVRAASGREGAILRAVTDALPNVTGIALGEVLATVARLLDRIAAAIGGTAAVTLAAGVLVLAGAVAAGQRRRTAEAVILKTLGATRRQIRLAWLVEYGVLGSAAGLIAAAVGTLASFGVMHYILHADWIFLAVPLAASVLGAVLLMLALGYAGIAVALRAKAAPLLRNE